MPRQIVLDVSVLRPWSLRGLFLGLADREPPVVVPRWSSATLAALQRGIEDDLLPRHGADASRAHARGAVEHVVRCLPDAEVPVAGDLQLDLLDLPDAVVVEAAVAAGADTIVTTGPQRFSELEIAPLGLCALHPDALLMELHADDPWRVLHATALYAFVLRGRERSMEGLLALLQPIVPRFVDAIRRQLGALPTSQAPAAFAATHGQLAVTESGGDRWWCITCDPFPCPGHHVRRLRMLGTTATCLADDECCFVGVTQTAQHWTLVWSAPDDPALLEIAEQMNDQFRNPRVAPYSPSLGPAVSYWEWEATGRSVHGFHDPTPPAR